MDSQQRLLIRTAQQIYTSVVASSREGFRRVGTELSVIDLESGLARIARARELGWHLAADWLAYELTSELKHVAYQAQTAIALVEPTVAQMPESWGELARDLLALPSEFPEVRVDLDNHELVAVTDPITLEGVYLGVFEIRLSWDATLGRRLFYYIRSLEHDDSDLDGDSIPHPHVNNEELCAGDGSTAIRDALDELRLLDFFTVVYQVLQTYSPGNAYRALANWDGKPCGSCGETRDEDDLYTCGRCADLVCQDCTFYCPSCNLDLCGSCGPSCVACHEPFCLSCHKGCRQCSRWICSECLEEGLCETCRDNPPPPSQENPNESCVEFSADGLGQAGVSA